MCALSLWKRRSAIYIVRSGHPGPLAARKARGFRPRSCSPWEEGLSVMRLPQASSYRPGPAFPPSRRVEWAENWAEEREGRESRAVFSEHEHSMSGGPQVVLWSGRKGEKKMGSVAPCLLSTRPLLLVYAPLLPRSEPVPRESFLAAGRGDGGSRSGTPFSVMAMASEY